MNRTWIALALASALAGGSIEETAAQTAAQPIQLAQDQSGGATSGGATSGGATSGTATSEAPAATTPDEGATQSQELPPGPAAGADAPTFGVNPLLIGGAIVAGAVICALACFSNSSSTTTTTHH